MTFYVIYDTFRRKNHVKTVKYRNLILTHILSSFLQKKYFLGSWFLLNNQIFKFKKMFALVNHLKVYSIWNNILKKKSESVLKRVFYYIILTIFRFKILFHFIFQILFEGYVMCLSQSTRSRPGVRQILLRRNGI